jgi:hypothetical protein
MAGHRSDVRVGDAIVYSKYGGHTITIAGEQLLILDARDVLAVANVTGKPLARKSVKADPRRSAVIERLESMLTAVAEIQADEAATFRKKFIRAMMVAEIDPVPDETRAQTQRLTRQRERLLATGAYTTDALAQRRGDAKPTATHTWLSRRRKANELFTVTHDGNTLVPTFQLDESARPRKGITEVLKALAPAQLGGWATWTWFTSASPWLGGSVPAEVLAVDPTGVARAAARFAANAA